MKKIAAGIMIVAVAIGFFVLTKRTERRVQFLQKGVPVATADVYFLFFDGKQHAESRIKTAADGSLCLPDTYKGGMISMKVTKHGDVIRDFCFNDIPSGITTFDDIASNRTLTTTERVWLGIFAETTTIDQTNLTPRGERDATDRLRGAGEVFRN